MFRDLKEYRQIQSIYENQVWISDEERLLRTCLDEQKYTEDDINSICEDLENDSDIIVNELLNELEEEFGFISQGIFTETDLTEGVGAAVKIIGAFAKGLKGVKALPAARNVAPFARLGAGFKKAQQATKVIGRNPKKYSLISEPLKKTFKGYGVAGGKIGPKKPPFVVPPLPKLPKGTGTVAAAGAAGLGGGFVGGKLAQNPNTATKDDIKALADKIKNTAPPAPPKPPEPPKIEAPKSPEDAGKKAADAGKKGGTSFGDAIKLNTPKPQPTVIQNTMKDGGKKVEKKAPPTSSKPKKMGEIERQNRERFGDKRVDFLKQKQKDFKLMRSKAMSKDDFAKKYPNSNTAKDMKKRSRKPAIMDYESYTLDAYDTVLEYLSVTEQASTLEEANYIMMEMDQQTIGDIVSETKPIIEGVINELSQRNPYEIIIEYLIQEEVASSVDEAVAIIEELDDETLQQVLDEGFMDRVKSGVKGALSGAAGAVGGVVKAAGGAVDKVKTAIGNRINRRKENVAINKKIKDKQSNVDQNNPGKTKSQIMALNRKKEKLNNPKEYARKQNMSGAERAKEMARARLAAKNK